MANEIADRHDVVFEFSAEGEGITYKASDVPRNVLRLGRFEDLVLFDKQNRRCKDCSGAIKKLGVKPPGLL